MQRITGWDLARIAVAGGLLTGLAAFVGRMIVPGVSTVHVVGTALAGAALALVAMLAVALASITVRRVVLRRGGTDAQWLWFGKEPPGLVRLRDQDHLTDTTRQEGT